MKDKKIQQKNNVSIFLNEYFNAIIIVVMIFIFALSYFIFLGPKLNSTKLAISDNIATQKKLYAEQEKKLEELKVIKSVYDNILPSDLHKFNQVLPSSFIKESLYGELEEIVYKQGFILGSVTIEETIEDEGSTPADDLPLMGGTAALNPNIGKVTFNVQIDTIDYRGLKSLLKSLEASARLFDIDTVSFNLGESTADLKIITYYYKDKVSE
ncbi:MAG: hypothetical protein PWQ35_517 [Patescibacteria group bacterium]|nr:hypothetical protein [Patescibacteria group bacterium]